MLCNPPQNCNFVFVCVFNVPYNGNFWGWWGTIFLLWWKRLQSIMYFIVCQQIYINIGFVFKLTPMINLQSTYLFLFWCFKGLMLCRHKPSKLLTASTTSPYGLSLINGCVASCKCIECFLLWNSLMVVVHICLWSASSANIISCINSLKMRYCLFGLSWVFWHLRQMTFQLYLTSQKLCHIFNGQGLRWIEDYI